MTKEMTWMVLTRDLLEAVEDAEVFVERAKTEHENRLRRRDPEGALAIEHTLYVRVGRPIDDDHVPEGALDCSEVGDTVLISISQAPEPERFTEVTLRRDIVATWGEYGAHVTLFDALLKRAGLA